ncbi:transporter substrate-binding domain-containing protein [Butyrivibrio sp. FCS014]|uniref:transporter substrate-binding domain-containing protein n=1 Tax=Butyrivibrio sp. FCS014 TaxID=1408304 RepID=UPI0004663A57|nr:transporter substrate-binding domain-containing protein [Butyrivibrio sp. FCS014]
MFKKVKNFTAICLIGIFLLLCLYPVSVKASSTNDPKPVRVGYYQNEVFEDGASDGAVKKGYAYEYYRKISEYTGWDYEYVYGDFVTIYKMLLNGEVDLVAGLAYTPEREGIILYPDRAMGSERYGIVKHEMDASITGDVNTLQGKTIGVLDSAIVEVLNGFLEEREIICNVVTYNDYENLLSAFDKKDIDVMAAEIDGIYDRHHAQVLYSFGQSDYYLCVNKERTDLLDDLNAGQDQLFSDNPDYLSFLRNKYYTTSLSSRALTSAEHEWLTNNGQINIGYLNNYLPFSATDKDGSAIGMVSEVFPQMFKDLGISTMSFSYEGFDNYDDMVAAVDAGKIDVAFPVGGGLFYSEEDGLILSDPLTSTLTDLVYKENHPGGGAMDFAVNENNKIQYYYIKNNYPDSSIKLYRSIEDCLNAVIRGEVSYTTLSGLRTNSFLRQDDYEDLSFMQLPYEDDTCFGVKIGDSGLLKLLNRGISVMGDDYAQNMAFRYSEQMNVYTFKDFYDQYSWVFILTTFIIAVLIVLALIRDVKFNKKRLREKEKAQLEIEKANQDKFVFVNKMANYMRDPVRSMDNLVDLAGKSEDASAIKGYLGEISSYSRELSSIINNILNMSRFESGQIHIEDKNISRHFRGKRMLIVEDTLQNQMITGRILKQFGFEIQVATSGKEAYDKLNAAPEGYFDAVIIDTDINEGRDLEDAVKIRTLNNDGKALIPIVVLSSGETEDLEEYLEEKIVTGVIRKPYDIDSMTEVFTSIFKNAEV